MSTVNPAPTPAPTTSRFVQGPTVPWLEPALPIVKSDPIFGIARVVAGGNVLLTLPSPAPDGLNNNIPTAVHAVYQTQQAPNFSGLDATNPGNLLQLGFPTASVPYVLPGGLVPMATTIAVPGVIPGVQYWVTLVIEYPGQ